MKRTNIWTTIKNISMAKKKYKEDEKINDD